MLLAQETSERLGNQLSGIFDPGRIFQQPGDWLQNLLHNIFGSIINIFLVIAGALAVIFFMYSGVLYITAGGDQEKAEKGKKGVIYASIGILIIALSFGVVRYLSRTLSGELATGQFTGRVNEQNLPSVLGQPQPADRQIQLFFTGTNGSPNFLKAGDPGTLRWTRSQGYEGGYWMVTNGDQKTSVPPCPPGTSDPCEKGVTAPEENSSEWEGDEDGILTYTYQIRPAAEGPPDSNTVEVTVAKEGATVTNQPQLSRPRVVLEGPDGNHREVARGQEIKVIWDSLGVESYTLEVYESRTEPEFRITPREVTINTATIRSNPSLSQLIGGAKFTKYVKIIPQGHPELSGWGQITVLAEGQIPGSTNLAKPRAPLISADPRRVGVGQDYSAFYLILQNPVKDFVFSYEIECSYDRSFPPGAIARQSNISPAIPGNNLTETSLNPTKAGPFFPPPPQDLSRSQNYYCRGKAINFINQESDWSTITSILVDPTLSSASPELAGPQGGEGATAIDPAGGEPTSQNPPRNEDDLRNTAPPQLQRQGQDLRIIYRTFPEESAPVLRVSGCDTSTRTTCRSRAMVDTITLDWEGSGIYQLRISGPRGTSYANVFAQTSYTYRPWSSGYYTFSVRKILGPDIPWGNQWPWWTSPWSNSVRVLVSPLIQF